MTFRGLARPPRRGLRAHYADRIEWRWYQKFLPEDLRLTAETLPREEWWEYKDDSIHLDRYPAEGSPRAKLLLLHGGGGNGRVLSPFAIMARRGGLEVVAPDMPGYGLTVRRRGLKPTYEEWTRIVCALIDRELEADGLPVILWGLSIGGMLAYAAAAANPRTAGLIATTLADTRRASTMAKVGRTAVIGRGGFVLAKTLGPLIDPITLPIRLLAPMRLISNDPDVSAVFCRDRLAGGSTVRMGFLRSLMNLRLEKEPEDFDHCPVLLVHPALDPWTPVELSRGFFDRIAAPKKLVILEGCGHFPVEEPGRRQLQEAVVAFVESVVAAPRSGEKAGGR